MTNSFLPLARRDELIVQTASDELVIYDRTTNKAYVLSPLAAAVWRACNGKRSVTEIAQHLSRETPMNEQTIWYALRELNDLLQAPVMLPPDMARISRRQFLKQAGLVAGAAAIPIVVKMVAPEPAAAQTGNGTGVCCVCFNNASPGPWFVSAANCEGCTFACSDDSGFVIQCDSGFCA